MKNSALVVAVFALPLILAAFAVGWTLSGIETEGSRAAPPQPQPVASTASTEEPVPRAGGEDVPGRDIAELSRPPDSTRVGYRQERLEGFTKTRAEYLTDADPDEIRAFYRETFASGDWVVADLGFSPEEWYFFVVKDEREALVEIHALQQPVFVEVELTVPDSPTVATPAPPPAPVPQIADDGDDDDDGGEEVDDDYYEGRDD